MLRAVAVFVSDRVRLVASLAELYGDCLSLLSNRKVLSFELSRLLAGFNSSEASEVDLCCCFLLCLSPNSCRIFVTLGQLSEGTGMKSLLCVILLVDLAAGGASPLGKTSSASSSEVKVFLQSVGSGGVEPSICE